MVLDINLEEGGLVAHAVNGPSFPLKAYSQTRFIIQEGQAEIEFFMNGGKKAQKLVISQTTSRKRGRELTKNRQVCNLICSQFF
jgi:hypothetical protein